MRSTADLLRILQFGDSALPVGAFSFSNGLESAIHHGIVRDRQTLQEFVLTAMRQSAAMDGIALLVTHRAARDGDIAQVVAADRSVFQRKLNEEVRTMTMRMGRKLGELAVHMIDAPLMREWLGRVAKTTTPGTYPVGLALVFAALGLPARDAFAVQQYGVATMMLGAALRLMRISFLDTQAILLAVNTTVDDAHERVADATLDDMASFAPLMDILAASHVKAHVRMFMN
jgi:urease accessory protein